MNDPTAIQQCVAGDREAFRHLVRKYEREALGHALSILGNRADAEDALQEAFLDAWRGLSRFDPGRRFYPWFYVILRNRCLKRAAKRGRNGTEPIAGLRLVAPAEDGAEDRADLLNRALARLSPADREILTLKHLDGLTYDRLAGMLEIPQGTVMSRLHHARHRLREALIRER